MRLIVSIDKIIFSMPQYQKQSRNATLRQFRLLWKSSWLLLMLWLSTTPVHAASPGVHSFVPTQQNHPADVAHLFLLPLSDTPVRLLTHTVDVVPSLNGDGSLTLTIAATYRLHNPESEAVTVLLRLVPARGDGRAARTMPTNVSLETDGQALPLQPSGENRQLTTELSLTADTRTNLLLRYTIQLDESALPALNYPMNTLNAWPTPIGSWRLTLTTPDQLSPDSWLRVEPDGWTYNGKRVQWLSENAIPQQPFVFQVVDPTVWRELQTLADTLATEPTSATFARQGALYQKLYTSPAANDAIRKRFYAQALAAYTDGVLFGQQTGLSAEQVAPLHMGLARLYRTRSVDTSGVVDYRYVALMTEEAQRALVGLTPANNPALYREANRWLVEGLQLQLHQARNQQDWSTALALLDRLAALPMEFVDNTKLAQERRALTLQQALQLLDQGNREAAIQLAGPEVVAGDLRPSPESQALFASWQVTVTTQMGHTALQFRIQPAPEQMENARLALDGLVQAWQRAGETVRYQQIDVGPEKGFFLAVSLPNLATRLALAQATPQRLDWALLRTLLLDSDPEVSIDKRLIWQQIELQQTLDLRAVADQWNAVAATLERQAAQFGAADDPGEADAALESTVRTQLQAIYHRQEASLWQNLVQNSSVLITLEAPAGSQPIRRTWAIQLTDPPQTLRLQTEALSFPRLWMAVLIGLLGIVLLAGMLWLLL